MDKRAELLKREGFEEISEEGFEELSEWEILDRLFLSQFISD